MISRLVYLKGLHPSCIGFSLLAIDCLNERSITSVNPVSILRTAHYNCSMVHNDYLLLFNVHLQLHVEVTSIRSVYKYYCSPLLTLGVHVLSSQ